MNMIINDRVDGKDWNDKNLSEGWKRSEIINNGGHITQQIWWWHLGNITNHIRTIILH